jgi:hypothetical protein
MICLDTSNQIFDVVVEDIQNGMYTTCHECSVVAQYSDSGPCIRATRSNTLQMKPVCLSQTSTGIQ